MVHLRQTHARIHSARANSACSSKLSGSSYNGVCVALEFDKPEAVFQLSKDGQKNYWERVGRLSLCGYN